MKITDLLTGPVPAIAIPICASDAYELVTASTAIAQSAAQIAELRLDYWPRPDMNAIAASIERLHESSKFIIVTLRTKSQGGHFAGSSTAYAQQYRMLFTACTPDAIDVELTTTAIIRDELVALAHTHGVAVIASHHDFTACPPQSICKAQLHAEHAFADVLKLAVTPHTAAETTTLCELNAWARLTFAQPAIVIGMGAAGQATRIATGENAPALTFATLGQGSAPGQLSLATVLAAFTKTAP